MIRIMKKLIFFLLIYHLLIPSIIFCQNIYWPYESKFDNSYIIKNIIRDVVSNNSKEYPFSTNLLLNPIALYQRSLSNSSCQYYPSCSRYTYLSISKHGSMKGLVLGAERFTRCFYLTDPSKYFKVGPYYYDPPRDYFIDYENSLNNDSYEIFLHNNLQNHLAYTANPVIQHENIINNIYKESDSLLFLFSLEDIDYHELGFAWFLYQNHNYYQASNELYRYLYKNQNNLNNYSVLLLTALCNFQSGRYINAANLFSDSAMNTNSNRNKSFSKYMQGLSLLYDYKYSESKETLSKLLLSNKSIYFQKQILATYIVTCIKSNDMKSVFNMLNKFDKHDYAIQIY